MDNIAYVPASRWVGVEGSYEYVLDPVTGEAVREIELYRRWGAAYDLKKDSTKPADPDIVKQFRAGEIQDIAYIARGCRGRQVKYPIGYKWGDYEVVGHAKRGEHIKHKYIIRCSCGRERRADSSAMTRRRSCIICSNRRKHDRSKRS